MATLVGQSVTMTGRRGRWLIAHVRAYQFGERT
jgi:hypothetical protein